MKAVVLAAGVGKRFGARTRSTPKCLIPLGETNLLSRYLEAFRQTGLRDVVIVVGHRQAMIRRECRLRGQGLKIRFVVNPAYREGSVLSLASAASYLKGGAIIMDADVFFPASALGRLIKTRGSAFLLDPRSKSAGEEMMVMGRAGRPLEVSKRVNRSLTVFGEATGIFRLAPEHAGKLAAFLRDYRRRGIHRVEYEETYTELCKAVKVRRVPIGNVFWSEMDFEEDWKRISARLARETKSFVRRVRGRQVAAADHRRAHAHR